MSRKKQSMLPEWKKGKARLNPTTAALMSRGVDNQTATQLVEGKWTLSKLQQQSGTALKKLGLRPEWVANIQTSDRPPIPFDVLARVLIASKFTCCVCHEQNRGVIIHHIADWAKSHDHSEPNLAVLCLQDHDRAHSRLAHTQNLTPRLIRNSKKQWEEQVARLDASSILTATALDFDCWWYFNRQRLFAMADDVVIEYRTLSRYFEAHRDGWINTQGHLQPDNRMSRYSLEGRDGGSLYAYLSQILDQVLSGTSVLNISDDLDKGILSAILKPGHFVFLQGAFRFLENSQVLHGRGQTTEMYRKANSVRVSCILDRWESTSNSAWSSYLKGTQEASALLRVVSLQTDTGILEIQTSALAIGAPQANLKLREYSNAPYRRGYYQYIGYEKDE